MEIVMNVLRVTLEEGLMYALLAIGVYITYSILDFPDLSVDGTMPMGAIVTAVLIIHGVNPWLCLAITFALGRASPCQAEYTSAFVRYYCVHRHAVP